MNTKNTAALALALPSLATLVHGSVGTAQRGRKLKVYRPESAIDQTKTPALCGAIQTLLEQGFNVRVFDAGRVWAPTIVSGTLVWNAARTARKVRTQAKVEVVL